MLKFPFAKTKLAIFLGWESFSLYACFYSDQVYMCSIGEIMGSESWEKKADNLVSNLPSGILSIEWEFFFNLQWLLEITSV